MTEKFNKFISPLEKKSSIIPEETKKKEWTSDKKNNIQNKKNELQLEKVNISSNYKNKLIDKIDNSQSSSSLKDEDKVNSIFNNHEEQILEEEEIEEERGNTTQKIINKISFTIIKAQIKAYLIWLITTFISFILPYFLIFLGVFIIVFFIYYLYIVSNIQLEHIQQIENQLNSSKSWVQTSDILASHDITIWGSWVPMWAPTKWQFDYGTFIYHQQNEHITAIDFTPLETWKEEEVRSTMAWTILFIWDGWSSWNFWWCPLPSLLGRYISYGISVAIWNKVTGYVTEYLHLSSVNPQLKIWDEVWYWTFLGTMWTTWCSSWVHLHYEIRKWKPVLNSSDFPSYWHFWPWLLWRKWYTTVSPEEYLSSIGSSITENISWHYIVNFFLPSSSNIDISLNSSSLESLTKQEQDLYWPYVKWRVLSCWKIAESYDVFGNTVEERMKFALKKWWSPIFQPTYDTWIRSWITSKIDPVFLLCIGIRETSLWRYLKSKNNVWNVGNNDRGDIMEFDTPEDWIKAIPRVLNNQYLGSKNDLISLTWCWEKRSPVYWTWEWILPGWIGCISAIKNAQIPENWNFRLDRVTSSSNSWTPNKTIITSSEEYDFISDNSLFKFVSPNISYINKSYEPQNLVVIEWNNIISKKDKNWNPLRVRQETLDALIKMSNDFYSQLRTKISVVSGYRSYKYQTDWNCSDILCVKPWFSEHQSGLAVDLFSTDPNMKIVYNKEYKWLTKNAHKYWFTQSYQGPDDLYPTEEWHWRYVWVELATKLKNENLTFTKFYNLKSKK